MKGYITKEQLSDSLKNELSEFSSQLENSVNGINIEIAWGIKQNIDQTTELQDRINNLKNNSVVVFPGNNYIFKEIVINNKKNIKFVGYNSKLINDDSFKNIFKITNSENITIEGFNVDCSWTSFQDYIRGQFVYCENSTNIKIINNIMKRGGLSFLKCFDIYVDNNKLTDTQQLNSYPILVRNTEGVTITSNKIDNAKSDAIKISMELNGVNNTKNIIVSNNIISNCLYDGIDLFAGGYKAIVTNNIVTECEKGIHVKAWGGTETDYSTIEGYSKDVIIEGNQLYNNRHQGVWVGSDNVVVTNNILTDSPYGVYIMSAKQGMVKNTVISNNIIKDISINAICSESETEEIFINGNFIENVVRYGLFIRSYNISIDNNTLIDVGERGISISSSLENNRVSINNTKIINKNKNTTTEGFVISGSLKDVSVISNCICEQIVSPLISQSIKEYDNSWNKRDEYRTEIIQITKDLQVEETQTINTTLNGNIKKITAFGVVQNTNKTFSGVYANNVNQCIYTLNDSGNYTNTSYCIAFAENLTDRTFGKIQNIGSSSFDIVWTKTGDGANGSTAKINLVVEVV